MNGMKLPTRFGTYSDRGMRNYREMKELVTESCSKVIFFSFFHIFCTLYVMFGLHFLISRIGSVREIYCGRDLVTLTDLQVITP
jgi:hypothetical protein